MKIPKTPLMIFFVFLFLTCTNVQAESWKTVVGGSDGFARQEPEKEITVRDSDTVKPLNVVFVGGYDATYKFMQEGTNYENNVRNAFKGHNVKFYREPTKKELLEAILTADVLYISAHGGVYKNTWQCLQVAPSGDNNQINSKNESLITSLDIKNALAGNKTPKLVVFNTCNSTDLSDGVESENRFTSAFGIDANTKGKAYVGWSKWVVGNLTDYMFKVILCNWARRDRQGKYPSFANCYYFMKRKCTATLIGDSSITVVGDYPEQHILIGIWTLTGECVDFYNSSKMKKSSGTMSFTKEGKFEISYKVTDSFGNVENLKDNGSWIIQDDRLNVFKINKRSYHGDIDDNSRSLTLKAGGHYDWKFQLTKK